MSILLYYPCSQLLRPPKLTEGLSQTWVDHDPFSPSSTIGTSFKFPFRLLLYTSTLTPVVGLVIAHFLLSGALECI